jgi:hypothetical protein
MNILNKSVDTTGKMITTRQIGYKNKKYTLNKFILFGSRNRDDYQWDCISPLDQRIKP